MDKTKIARINALAKKAKTVGLNERETAERDALRKEYLAEMRASFKAQLASTYVQTADGAKIPYAEYARTAKEATPMTSRPSMPGRGAQIPRKVKAALHNCTKNHYGNLQGSML